jgi:CO/xanthine dehydrogenase Mo-binding subunit
MNVGAKRELTIVGKSVPRLDALDKATGKAAYGVDQKLPGMLWGKLVRSQLPHARILKVDTSRAKAMPGVECVITGEDVPDRKIGRYINDMYALAKGRVRYVGEPVAAVAAVDEETAQRAVEAVEVEYEELPAVFDMEEAMADSAPVLHEQTESEETWGAWSRTVHPLAGQKGRNVCNRLTVVDGDIDAAFAGADLVFADSFSTHVVQHCHLEPHAALASVSHSGEITVWTNNQRPFELRSYLGHLLDVPATQIRVIGTEVGGGFGAKKAGWERFPVLLALKCGKPVKMVMTRDEEFIDGYTSVPVRITVKSAVRRDGMVTARAVTMIWDTGAYCNGVPPSMAPKFHAAGTYRIPNLRFDSLLVYTNKVPATTYRGIGGQDIAWAIETHMDEIARKVGLDPVEFRLKNIFEEGSRSPGGAILRGVGLKECLEKAAVALEWGQPKAKNRGKGIACFDKHPNPASSSSAVVWLNEDGKVTLLSGAMEIGQGLTTVLAQVCAEELGVKIEDIKVVIGDTGTTPFDDGAYGSRLTEHAGNAVRLAAKDAREQILKAAARRLEVSEDDLDIKGGRVFVKGSPDRGISLSELSLKLHRSEPGPILGRGSHFGGGKSYSEVAARKEREEWGWKYGATGVEIEVDTETGAIEILKVVSAHDVGFAINPHLVEGQIEGTVVMGLANFLLEEMQFDGGRVVNPTFMDYGIPTALECPSVVSIIVEKYNQEGPFGAKGVGELPIVGIGAALANAVYDAVGIRIKTSPITPEKVLRAIEEQKAS